MKKKHLNEVVNGTDTENVMVEMNAFGSLSDRDLEMVVGGFDNHSKSSRIDSASDQGEIIHNQTTKSDISKQSKQR